MSDSHGQMTVAAYSVSPKSATGSGHRLFGRPNESYKDAEWDPEPIEVLDESRQKRFRYSQNRKPALDYVPS